MRLIAFDTSTEWCTAALWVEGDVRFREVHAGQKHSELLVPMVHELCDEAGLRLSDLQGLVYGVGPGSFTGLRIACGVAQGLALGAGLPVLGVSTLEALAEETRMACGAERVLACLDARMNEVYAALYHYQAGQWQCQRGPVVCAPAAMPLPSQAGYCAAGSGFLAYPDIAGAIQPALAKVMPEVIPHARAMAQLAAPRFANGEGGPAESAEPLYIRDKVALKISERQNLTCGVRA